MGLGVKEVLIMARITRTDSKFKKRNLFDKKAEGCNKTFRCMRKGVIVGMYQ